MLGATHLVSKMAESGGHDPQCSCTQPASNGCWPPASSLSKIGGERVHSKPMPCGTIGFQDRDDTLIASLSQMDLPTGVEPALAHVRSVALCPLSYGRSRSPATNMRKTIIHSSMPINHCMIVIEFTSNTDAVFCQPARSRHQHQCRYARSFLQSRPCTDDADDDDRGYRTMRATSTSNRRDAA